MNLVHVSQKMFNKHEKPVKHYKFMTVTDCSKDVEPVCFS